MSVAVEEKRIENAFQPQVAGGFYTDDPIALRRQVDRYIEEAAVHEELGSRDIVGILSPHAGYQYSGPVAGEAFRAVLGRDYKTVVVLALSHRRTYSKAAILDRPAYDTPLGSLAIDEGTVRHMLKRHGELFDAEPEMFVGEHSLEVQLPFVQVALPRAHVVPIIVAVHDSAIVAQVGAALFSELGARKDILFVMSSDLTHYYPYDEAVELDNRVLTLLEDWRIDQWLTVAPSKEGMCGSMPMLSFVKLFENYPKDSRKVARLDYKNSGDTAGGRMGGVVGYGALAFTLEPGVRTDVAPAKDFGPLGVEERRFLTAVARAAVRAAATGEIYNPEPPAAPLLNQPGAAFVTLRERGGLRGCIGHVMARMPLYACVAEVARSAAVHDTRFPAVTEAELEEITYELSVLTAPKLTSPEEVIIGRHGLIVNRGIQSGLLLPQVPVEWNWTREEFLSHTCLKAGLEADAWKDPEVEIRRFRAIVWGEEDL